MRQLALFAATLVLLVLAVPSGAQVVPVRAPAPMDVRTFATLAELQAWVPLDDGQMAATLDSTPAGARYQYSYALGSWFRIERPDDDQLVPEGGASNEYLAGDRDFKTVVVPTVQKQWYETSGDPDLAVGADGDWAYDPSTKVIYRKSVTYSALTITNRLADERGSVTSPVTPTGTAACTNGNLYLVAVAGWSTDEFTIDDLAGCGITWTPVKSVRSASGKYAITVFRGLPVSGATTGQLTVSFTKPSGGAHAVNIAVSVNEITGMVTTGSNGQDAIAQAASAAGTSATSLTVPMLAFEDATHNATFVAFGSSTSMTEKSGFTEVSDYLGAEVQWKASQDLSPTATRSPAPGDMTGVAIEVAAAQTGSSWSRAGILVGAGDVLQAQPADPTGTASATDVMMGLGSGVTFTPKGTRAEVRFDGTWADASATNPTTQVRYGTGTAPVNGAAAVGTTVGPKRADTAIKAGGFSVGGIATGLTPGTTYWFDLAMSSSAGTLSAKTLGVTVKDA